MNDIETDRPIIVYVQCTRIRSGECDFTNWRDDNHEPGMYCPNCHGGILVLMDWAKTKGL